MSIANVLEMELCTFLLNKEIVEIKDLMTNRLDKAWVIFKNGHRLSVIRGKYSISGSNDLFEIMPPTAVLPDDHNDTVIRNLTIMEVGEYLSKASKLQDKIYIV